MTDPTESRDPGDLTPHPYNARLYRQRTPSLRFIEDIAEKMEEPLIINEEGEIIDGVRRWLAVSELRWDSVEVIERSYPSAEVEKKAILRHNDDRDENFSQKIRVAMEYEEMVAPILEERMKAGKSLEEQENHPMLKSEEGATAIELAGDRVGWGKDKYRHAKSVWKAKESGDAEARKLVTCLDSGKISVNKAYEELNDRKDKMSRDENYIVRGLTDQDVYAEEKTEAYGPVQASFETSPSKFHQLLSKSAPYQSLEPKHVDRSDNEVLDLYLEIGNDGVRISTSELPHVIQSRHTISEGYFEDVILKLDSPVGIVIPSDLAKEMLRLMDREVRVELRGSGDSKLARVFVMTDGQLYTWIVAPDHHEDSVEQINPKSKVSS